MTSSFLHLFIVKKITTGYTRGCKKPMPMRRKMRGKRVKKAAWLSIGMNIDI